MAATSYCSILNPLGQPTLELWILLASWRVTLKKFVASTMRTCLLTTCALLLARVCSGVLLACTGLPPHRLGLGLRLRLEGV